MVIGFDGSRAFVPERTGTEKYSYELLKSLAHIDHKNTYIVYLRPDSQVDLKDWPENFQFKVLNYPRLWTQAGLALQTFTDKIDVLFVPAHTLPILRKPGLKTVMTVHDLGAEFLPTTHQLKQRLYLGFITKYQLNCATKLISVSQSTKKDLINQGIEGEKISVIYEGFDNSLFKPPSLDIYSSILKQFDLENQKYFLFVGTIQPRKNLGNLIKAFKGFKNVFPQTEIKLVLAGGKGWLSEDIFTLPKKLGIKECVKFLGRVKDEELPALYSGALAFTYPSLYEGFGLPILEAMACSCPVITSNSSSLPEVAGDGAIYADPLSVEQILEAMFKIAQNDSLRDNLITKGSKQVEKFSWEKCAQETLEVLRN